MAETRTARLFRNGRSQAIRLPQEFGFAGDRVRARRMGHGVLLDPLVADVNQWFGGWIATASSRYARGSQPAGHPGACAVPVSFLLDTNACIASINGSPAQVRRRLEEAINREDSRVRASERPQVAGLGLTGLGLGRQAGVVSTTTWMPSSPASERRSR